MKQNTVLILEKEERFSVEFSMYIVEVQNITIASDGTFTMKGPLRFKTRERFYHETEVPGIFHANTEVKEMPEEVARRVEECIIAAKASAAS